MVKIQREGKEQIIKDNCHVDNTNNEVSVIVFFLHK